MKHLLTFLRHDVSATLALTVGSPSFDRRGTMLKHYAFMLLFLLGSLNVWGTSPVQSTFSKNSTISNNQVTEGGVTWTINTGTKTGSPAAPAGANFQRSTGLKFGESGSKYYKPVTFTTSYFDDYNVTAVEVYICNNGNKAGTLTVTQGSTQIGTQTETFGTTWTVLKAETQSGNGGALSISYSVDQAFCINYIKVTYTGSTNPTISTDPVDANYVVGASATALTVEATASAGDLHYKWYSNTTESTEGASIVGTDAASYTPSTTSAGTTYYYCVVTDGNGSATSGFAAVKVSEPTGTFALFSGDLVEGDYVIYYSGKALKNTITSSSRFDYLEVSPENAKLTNPDEAIIWHIAASGDYWTIYNAAVKQYAAGTSSMNQGALVADGTADLALWTASGSSTYDFENKGRAAATSESDKKWLRNNGNYGFACYASTTGGALTLYKKALPKHSVTFNDAPTGGSVAVSVGGSDISSGDQVEEGATVTITPTASTYYQIASVTQGEQAITPVQGVYSFTMPSSDVAIAATFEYIPVTSLTLNKTELELLVDAEDALSVTAVEPADAYNGVTWDSDNEDVVMVDEDGAVLAMGEGTATITATSVVTSIVTATCAVTVNAASGHEIGITSANGTVVATSDDEVIDIADVLKDVAVVLTATPNDGYSISEWTVVGADYSVSQDKTTCSFTMPDNEVLVEVTYTHEVAVLKLHDAAGVAEFAGNHFWKEELTLPTFAASCSKEFMGWSADENCNTAPELGATYVLPNKGENHIYAVYADETPGAETKVTDNINLTFTGVSGQSYVAWESSKTGTSGAVYTGVNAGGKSAIQFRSDVSDTKPASGIISTTSGGKAKKITITWNSETANDRTLNVFGSNTAYTAVADLVDDNKKGTLLGTVVKGTSTELNITGDYKYIGVRSNSGAMYLDKIAIEWAQAGEPSYSNYSTTCAAAPEVVVNPEEVNAPAAGIAAGVIEALYENVNKGAVSVALFNDAACNEPFDGGWLTASLDEDKNITYTIEENTSYNDARSAYIRLIAPETSGAASPADVRIPVSQVKKAAVFASLEELAAADVNANTEVTVSFSDVVIKEIYMYNSDRRGLVFNIQKDGEDVKIYFNADVPAAWVAGGKVSGTLTNCPWKIYSGAWQLAPASGWAWDQLTYTAPPAIESIEIRGNATQKTYIDGQVFDHTGLTVWAIYSDTHEKEVTTLATWTYNPAKLSKDDTEVTVTATYNEKSDDETVTGLTVNPIPDKTIAEFIAAGGTRCYLEGTVGTIDNTKYGNFKLTDDASGTIYVYGCLTPEGESAKFNTLGVSKGDKIKVIAEQYLNHETAGDEAVNVVFVSKVSPVQITIADKNLEVGHSWTIEATTDPAAAVDHISYSIKNDGSDAYVSLEGNVITANDEGTATIIASIPDGDGYLTNSIEFNVHVTPAIVRTGIYAKVTSNEELKDGEYLIVYEDGSLAFNGGLETLDAFSNNFAVTIESNKIIATAEIDAKSFTITNGTIKSASGKFIGKTANSNGMNESSEEQYTNTISIDGSGNAVILSSGGAYLRYNSDSGQERFRYFKSASYTGQKAIQLYRKMDYTRAVSGNYGTICLPKAGVMTNGALYEISYYDADQKKIFFDEVEGGVMVAGAPYIFKPNEGVTELKVLYTGAENVAEAGHNNGLIGHYDLNYPEEGAVDARQYLTNGDYFLRNNEYWLVDQENRVYVDNYRAYIKLNQINPSEQSLAPGRRRVAMNVNGEQTATGFENAEANEAPRKVLIDGQLFILRGEKVYDAKGQLVK